MKWVGYIARMGEMRHELKVSVGKPEEKRQLGRPENLGIDEKIILDWILRK